MVPPISWRDAFLGQNPPKDYKPEHDKFVPLYHSFHETSGGTN